MKKSLQEVKVAHSPDSDDAFMFYALATNKVGIPGVKFTHILSDIEDLNRRALQGEFEVSAVSFHAYPFLQDRYRLLNHGGSVGFGYGPMIVASRPMSPEEALAKTVAIAGERTTSALVLRLCSPQVKTTVVPFDQIIPAIVEGKVEAGLLIHEGQLTYASAGLHKILDLGKWWLDETGLPLPLGGNVIRRDLPLDFAVKLSQVLKASIQYGLDHREEALAYAHQFARDMDDHLADQFVGMYVNERTVAYGADDKRAIAELLGRAYKTGAIPVEPKLDFLD
ncbi:MAG TPA: MqnA/MqnD/SBP family protein [Terriglobales bacterium]|nr:MqnA/MqnD/SBP family protein [Terriglobales bacterium]